MSTDQHALNSDTERGIRIRELRKARCWSQQKAADAIGVTREMFARWEAGAEPGARALAAMVTNGLDVGYILTGRAELAQAETDVSMTNMPSRKAKQFQHPELVKAAGVLAELATALKCGSLQGCVEHNEATGLFDRLMPPRCAECGEEKYAPLTEMLSALFLVRDHLRSLRSGCMGTPPSRLQTLAKSRPPRATA